MEMILRSASGTNGISLAEPERILLLHDYLVMMQRSDSRADLPIPSIRLINKTPAAAGDPCAGVLKTLESDGLLITYHDCDPSSRYPQHRCLLSIVENCTGSGNTCSEIAERSALFSGKRTPSKWNIQVKLLR